MIDAVGLLGSLLQQGATPAAPERLQSVVRRGTGGPLDQAGDGVAALLGGLFGQLGACHASSGGGEHPAKVILLAKRDATALAAGADDPAASGRLGALAGALLGGRRGAIGGGVLAVLGSLAQAALQDQGDAPAAATETWLQHRAMLALRAMLQAAKADGQIDAEAMARIMGCLAEAGEADDARQMVLRAMSQPVDLAGLAAEARNAQEAAEIYAASLLAVPPGGPAERDYLARLAAALALPAAAVAHIQARLGA